MAYQTTYSLDSAAAVAGQVADSSAHVIDSYVSEGACVVGNLVMRGTTKATQVKPMVTLAADAVALSASGLASAATAQTITTFNGATGTGLIVPAQQITLTLNSHANWDATTAQVTYEDPWGNRVSEDVLIPDAGNATVSTVGAARRILSIVLPAQSGTNGTFTVGTIPTAPVFTLRNHAGIVTFDASRQPYTTGNALTDKDPCAVISKGRVWVSVEAAVNAGEPVYVRAVTASSNVPGQFGAKATNFGQLMDAIYLTTTSGAGLAIVQLG